MKVLITGFTPFKGEKINPSYEAVKMLPDYLGETRLIKERITTEFGKSKDELLSLIEKHRPDSVICVGQAGGRSCITVEKIAINYAVADGYDPEGVIKDGKIDLCGAAAYFSTVPAEKTVAAVREAGIPCSLSLSAGAFVCNYVMYCLLRATENEKITGGFIHIPFSPEQGTGKAPIPPTMDLRVAAKALEIAVSNIFGDKIK